MGGKPRTELRRHLERKGIEGADNRRLADFLMAVFSQLGWLLFLYRRHNGLEKPEKTRK